GKTTLLDQILFNSGIIQKAELPETGRTVSDYTDEEKFNKFSIYTTLSNFIWKDCKFNIFDTPGSPDFIGEVVEAFRAAESTIMVIDGKNGIEIETIKLWRRLDKRKMPRAIFINKMDMDGADYYKIISELEAQFNLNFVPVTMPMGSGNDYSGVINLIEQKAYLTHDSKEKDKQGEIPSEYLEIVKEKREQMIELAAEGEDALIEKFFEEGVLDEDEIRKGLTIGMRTLKVIPVLCGSSELNNGIASLLNFMTVAAPSPFDLHEVAYDEKGNEMIVDLAPDKDVSLFSFKTKIDQFAGKLSFVKVITGTLDHDTELVNPNKNAKEKVHKIFTVEGKDLKETQNLSAGDIGVLAKQTNLETNDTLCSPNFTVKYHNLRLPQPVYSLSIKADSKKNEDKLADALHKVAEQDRTFIIRYNPETKETVISGMGELHIRIILENITKKLNVEPILEPPKIAYREAITQKAEAEFSHKKQSGGHGQYAKVLMRFEPLERGKVFEFSNEIKGGSVSRGYLPGVEKGIREAMEEGYIAGYPIVDLKATIYDGKEHPVDSSEMAFKLAAKGALKSAMESARPVLLEPICIVKILAEEKFLGDILSDISSKRGKVLTQTPVGGNIFEIDAEIAQAELQKYSADLKAITSGTASFEIEFSHYESISGKIADKVIEAAKIHTPEHV
ncbi:MAG: elongation factor G, partial [Spirochaetales bacterium]|nr:elongation factor G [Spirochaetales bacterium]